MDRKKVINVTLPVGRRRGQRRPGITQHPAPALLGLAPGNDAAGIGRFPMLIEAPECLRDRPVLHGDGSVIRAAQGGCAVS
jgi:hypothetical protein